VLWLQAIPDLLALITSGLLFINVTSVKSGYLNFSFSGNIINVDKQNSIHLTEELLTFSLYYKNIQNEQRLLSHQT
jgi:hypothetical protein